MKALVWHGTTDIRCDTVPDPEIEDARDAIIKVTSCAICGSDLHLYNHFMPGMKCRRHHGPRDHGRSRRGRIGAKGKLKVGDRMVDPLHDHLRRMRAVQTRQLLGLRTDEPQRRFADTAFGHTTAGLFGYTHLTGGYPGGQAEYLRVPFADTTHIKVPDGDPTNSSSSSATSSRPAGRPPSNATSSRPTRSRSGAAVRSAR